MLFTPLPKSNVGWETIWHGEALDYNQEKHMCSSGVTFWAFCAVFLSQIEISLPSALKEAHKMANFHGIKNKIIPQWLTLHVNCNTWWSCLTEKDLQGHLKAFTVCVRIWKFAGTNPGTHQLHRFSAPFRRSHFSTNKSYSIRII